VFLAMHAEQEKRIGLVNANNQEKVPAARIEVEFTDAKKPGVRLGV